MTDTAVPADEGALRHALGRRQMTMIAIGGVIGAGLFVGSGTSIKAAGPGIVMAYVVVGGIVILVMRMLAELAVAKPETGSFASYAGRELGPWARLSVGWLYAYHWCVTIGFEAIAGAAIMHQLVGALPTWLCALIFMVLLTGVNLARVRSYGEFEFWFATVKVAAIVVFLVIGAVAIVGLFPGSPAPGASNLTGHGGFLPHGGTAVLAISVVVFFSFFGTEAVTIAAGEATQPAESVRGAMRSVVWRILVFYIGSILVVVTLLPWNDTAVTRSPYTAVLERLHIPGAGTVMNLIVLTAVLSCLNSGIYASSRMVYALGRQGEAPRIFTRTTRAGVPAAAVLLASSVGFVTVVANYFVPTDTVYTFLLGSSGAVAVLTYLVIATTQIRGRYRLRREGRPEPQVRMWGFPYLSYVVMAALLAVLVGMLFVPKSRIQLGLTAVVAAVAVTAGVVRHRRRTSADASADTAATDTGTPAPAGHGAPADGEPGGPATGVPTVAGDPADLG